MLERLKATGARRIELKVERVDILVRKQVRCNGIVTTLKGIGGVVVAAAHMRVDDKVIGLARDSGIVDATPSLAHLCRSTGLIPVLDTKSVSQ